MFYELHKKIFGKQTLPTYGAPESLVALSYEAGYVAIIFAILFVLADRLSLLFFGWLFLTCLMLSLSAVCIITAQVERKAHTILVGGGAWCLRPSLQKVKS